MSSKEDKKMTAEDALIELEGYAEITDERYWALREVVRTEFQELRNERDKALALAQLWENRARIGEGNVKIRK